MATLETQYKNWLKENEPITYSEWLEKFSEIRNLDKLKNKMESKQTAVEWLIEQLTPSISLQQKHIDDLKEQAKEMEKEQKGYSEEEVFELLLKHQSDYRSSVRNTSPLDWSFDIKDWFEQFKKK